VCKASSEPEPHSDIGTPRTRVRSIRLVVDLIVGMKLWVQWTFHSAMGDDEKQGGPAPTGVRPQAATAIGSQPGQARIPRGPAVQWAFLRCSPTKYQS